jgi:hypothetical protein
MDQISDFGKFQRLMKRLCETMGKPISDELVESWWKSLRTVHYAEVERRMEAFIDRAGENTRFPRPGQFRPDDIPAAGDPKDEARQRRMDEDNARNWRAFIAEFPRTGPIRRQMAVCSRILLETHESSPAHAEAQYEYFQLEKQLGPNGRFSADS